MYVLDTLGTLQLLCINIGDREADRQDRQTTITTTTATAISDHRISMNPGLEPILLDLGKLFLLSDDGNSGK